MVHGSHEVVNAICDHPDIKAVSFVGSNAAGKHIYTRATAAGKRVQANTGAKNHAVVMPDADVEHAAKALVGAAFGAAGQRCMAISAIVVVGDPTRFEHALSEAARQLVVLSLHALSLARLVVSPSGHAYSVAIRRAHVRSRLRTSSVEVQQANHPSFIWTLFIWTSGHRPVRQYFVLTALCHKVNHNCRLGQAVKLTRTWDQLSLSLRSTELNP